MSQGLAYQQELEHQEWLESGAWIDEINEELSMIANREKELNAVDSFLESVDNQLVEKENVMEFMLTQLTGTEQERLEQVEALEKAMLPNVKSIQTYVKGKLVMELTPQ